MANPPSNVNPPGAPAAVNPLQGTGFDRLGDELNTLRVEMDAGSLSTKQLAQEQANLIDHHKALSEARANEMQQATILSNKIKLLKDSIAKSTAPTQQQISELAQLENQLKVSSSSVKSLTKAASEISKVLLEIVDETEKVSTSVKSQLYKETRDAGAEILRASGPVGKALKMAGTAAFPKFSAALSKAFSAGSLGAYTGGILAAWTAISAVFQAATRESSTFANSYAGSLGLALDAQLAFKESLDYSTRTLFSMVDAQKVGSVAMKTGAMDAYTSEMLMNNGMGSTAQRARILQGRMGDMSEASLKLGRALGLSAEQSGELMSSFIINMGAFSPAATNAASALNMTVNRFGAMSRMTGISMTRLFDMVGKVSESTLPMGVKFDVLTAQTTMAIQALEDYGKSAAKSGDLFLSSSANVQKMTSALMSYGASLSPLQTFGYQLAAGMNTAKDPVTGFLDAIQMSPLERIGAQLKGLRGAGITDTGYIVTAMRQSGLKDEYVKTMRGMLGNEKFESAFMRATQAKTPEEAKAAFAGFTPDVQNQMAEMATHMQVMRPPLEQLVDLTKNSVEYLSMILARLNNLLPGRIAKPLPEAVSANIPRHIRAGSLGHG